MKVFLTAAACIFLLHFVASCETTGPKYKGYILEFKE